jgi:hypothetical protein
VVDFGDDLRGHVGGSAAEGVDCAIFLAAQAETEVYELQLSVAVYEDVLSLDVSMYYV